MYRYQVKSSWCFPWLDGDPGLELGPAAVSEPGAHPEESLLDPGWPARAAQAEEGVVLHRALPQVLATPLRAQPRTREKA